MSRMNNRIYNINLRVGKHYGRDTDPSPQINYLLSVAAPRRLSGLKTTTRARPGRASSLFGRINIK